MSNSTINQDEPKRGFFSERQALALGDCGDACSSRIDYHRHAGDDFRA